ncbi:MAG: hypothetical protein LBO62_05390 [Endomicrobium sp.]|nr:hypothetical protein [Endomicrobium sp.]
MNKNLLFILILAIISAVLYFGNISNGYSYYDDYQEIILNPSVNPQNAKRGFPVELFTDIQSFHFYVPFKHLVNYGLHYFVGYNPHFSHLLSDFLHIFNVILCYLLILRLSKSYGIAFFTALLFCVSPICSNAINEIAARGHLFTVFFGFSSFYLYTFTNAKGLKHNQDRHFLAASVFLFFIGLFFWPTIIVLPALLFIYEISRNNTRPEEILLNGYACPFNKTDAKSKSNNAVFSDCAKFQRGVNRLIPFIAAASICIIVNLYVSYLRNSLNSQQAVFDNGLMFSLQLFGWESIYKIPAIIGDYIIFSFFPPSFDIIFAPPLMNFTQMAGTYIEKFAVILVFAAMSFAIYRKNKAFAIAPAFFIFFLLPGIIVMYKSELISLRYMYGASTGIFFTVCAFIRLCVVPRLSNKLKPLLAVSLALFIAFSFFDSFTRKRFWKNPQTVTDAMLLNGGLSEVWGWFQKINWEKDLNVKLTYLLKAKETLEKNKAGYELQYDLINQNLEGRINYIKALSENGG